MNPHDDTTADPSATSYTYEPAEEISPLLATAAVWLDPPEELRDEVVDTVKSQLH